MARVKVGDNVLLPYADNAEPEQDVDLVESLGRATLMRVTDHETQQPLGIVAFTDDGRWWWVRRLDDDDRAPWAMDPNAWRSS